MSVLLARWAKLSAPPKRKPHERPLSREEETALARLQREARQRGARLETGGKGGLPPSLVLGVMRRDGFRCRACAGSKRISVHHKGGIVTESTAELGHKNTPDNLVTICKPCHDRLHNTARSLGIDSSQVDGGRR